MAIQVTCPNCLKRFKVSDKFAGQTGPCPNCEKPIKIPAKSDEVVIHAPEHSGPKDSQGRPVLKPIKRHETRLSPPVWIGAITGTLLAVGVALGLRMTGEPPPTGLLAIAAVLLAPPIVVVGYWSLLSDEIEGFAWRELLVRTSLCSAIFAGLWGLYAYLPRYLTERASMAEISGIELAVYVPIMIAIGAAIAVLTLELEVMQGVALYIFYFAITFLLAWIAGVPLARPFASGDQQADSPPGVTAPADPGPESTEQRRPKLLQ
ncbi:MAG: hypothetical protein D6753_13645 [Planctomycetota bacterium]|nr:MAG: hypothetical protein D6753_13645 [Planctomycetota bacterium]